MTGVQWSVVVGAAVTNGPENVIAVVVVALHSLEILFFFLFKGTRPVFLIKLVVDTKKTAS